jgi:hypothetical protein
MNDLPKGKLVLSVDFDGVIHSYKTGWHGADVISDEIVPGALEFLAEASNYFEIYVFSSRSHQKGGLEAMQNWLWKQVTGEEYNSMGTVSCPVWLLKIRWPITKPPAFLSIDDRGFQFNGKFPDAKELLNFKPWNRGSVKNDLDLLNEYANEAMNQLDNLKAKLHQLNISGFARTITGLILTIAGLMTILSNKLKKEPS